VPQFPEVFTRAGASFPGEALSPSARASAKLVDRRLQTWKNIRAYFEPILSIVSPLSTEANQLDRVATTLYHLILATRASAQVYLNIAASIHDAAALLIVADRTRASEAAMRIARILGLFKTFVLVDRLPGFKLTIGTEISLRDRMDDILDDAYLAEAASMRRFLSIQANVASIRRDLRRLLRTITRTAAWAKGVVSVADLVVGKSAAGVAEAALDLGQALAISLNGTAIILSPRDRPPFGPIVKLARGSANHFVYLSPARSLHSDFDVTSYTVEYVNEFDPWNS